VGWEDGVVLNLLLIGVAVALDPLPLSAFVVVLPSRRGVRKGAAFLFGWLVSLAVVVTVTVAATGDNPPEPDTVPSLASLAVKIAVGAVLVMIAIRQRRRMRGRGSRRRRRSGRSTWTTCRRGSPWAWPRRFSPGP
jgi:threonine/homoserine/homoserine lactone efflux protein